MSAPALTMLDARDDLLLYRQVRAGHEWMTVAIAVRRHRAPAPAGLALAIHSSFGSFGFEWPSIGQESPDLTGALRFLCALEPDAFLGRITGNDRAEPDFSATLEAYRACLEAELDPLDPQSAAAQSLRLAHIEISEAICGIDDSWCDAHKVEVFLSMPELWAMFPSDAQELQRFGPSRRRHEAMGLHARLWLPFLRALRSEVGLADECHAGSAGVLSPSVMEGA